MAYSSPTCTLPYSNVISTIILHEKIIEISERNIVTTVFDDIQEQKIKRTKSAVRCICLSDRTFSISFFACKYAYLYLFVCMLDIWKIIFI